MMPEIKDKKDTLFFVLEGEMWFFDYNQIIEMVSKQTNNFYDRFGYFPAYINMEESIYFYLQKLLAQSVTYNMGPADRIFGMEIKTRSDGPAIALSDREAVCV